MALCVQEIDDVAVVATSGTLRGGPETEELEAKLRELCEQGFRKVLLDLSESTFMTSKAFGILFGCVEGADEKGVLFYLCSMHPRVRKVADLIWHERAPRYFETRQLALAELARS
ncbi:MAG: STAS domain-containing protein [Candidatus Latescibacterota bacterium]|nr:MAG: STAS domain-containing protein [Candidatus Latescibacterota bacterium]